MKFVGVDPKDIAISDMQRTLQRLEQTLRAAGCIEWQPYHNARDRELAVEFIKMADQAKASVDFAKELCA